jgi:hypothetical protein
MHIDGLVSLRTNALTHLALEIIQIRSIRLQPILVQLNGRTLICIKPNPMYGTNLNQGYV